MYMWHPSKTISRISCMTYFIDTYRYIHMTYILQWKPISEHIECKIWIWQTQMGNAPLYLCELSCPISGLAGQGNLHSFAFGILVVPFPHTMTMQHHIFTVFELST